MIDGSYGNIAKAYPDRIDGLGMTTTPMWDNEEDGNGSDESVSPLYFGTGIL